ncbi:MAG TPA: 2-hydroxyacid dehydrogenase [Candidatus Dormibacteraeota bacterium]|nr:2-hydroxyacid dehydrogenase [Candidatus Dormibacteraeota bacterium]
MREAMKRLVGLRVVQTLSAGVDWLVGDVPSGVTLCNASGVHDVPVSEWTLMAILAMQRELPLQLGWQQSARWHRPGPETGDLEGSTVLILGYGSIGRAVEARLLPFGVDVVRVARTARDGVHGMSDLASLLPRADVVVILLPLTDETRGIVDARFLAAMHDGALLVNAARGSIVDTAALVAEAQSGRLRAALDVTDPEPLPDGHPLWTAPGVLITPHTAGSSQRFAERAWRFVADQLGRYERGEPLQNVVVNGY